MERMCKEDRTYHTCLWVFAFIVIIFLDLVTIPELWGNMIYVTLGLIILIDWLSYGMDWVQNVWYRLVQTQTVVASCFTITVWVFM